MSKKFNIDLSSKVDLKNIKGHTSEGEDLVKEIFKINSMEEIALKSGYYFMIFNKSDIPFFNELKLVDYQIKKDNITYDVYEAYEWECAKKVDKLLGDDFIGYEIDEYKVERDFRI